PERLGLLAVDQEEEEGALVEVGDREGREVGGFGGGGAAGGGQEAGGEEEAAPLRRQKHGQSHGKPMLLRLISTSASCSSCGSTSRAGGPATAAARRTRSEIATNRRS